VNDFNACLKETIKDLQIAENIDISDAGVGDPVWFRASQMCAHDRYSFGQAGWGRLGIGLYVLFIEKWLEHFPPNQFLVLRLEDFKIDPQAYMEKVFSFLDLKEPDEHVWTSVLTEKHANAHHGDREPLLAETEELLRDFYKPYNDLLAKLTG
jgi:hypothetical protein